jgi:hypothetical protein
VPGFVHRHKPSRFKFPLFFLYFKKNGNHFYASYKISTKFRDLLEYIGELQNSGVAANSPEHINIIREKIKLFINAIRNDLQTDKNEHFDEG